jgi:hypothetical protein
MQPLSVHNDAVSAHLHFASKEYVHQSQLLTSAWTRKQREHVSAVELPDSEYTERVDGKVLKPRVPSISVGHIVALHNLQCYY